MKIVLDVKNSAKIVKPSKNNVILYDGETWYVTTKEDIFKEYETLVSKKLALIQSTLEELQRNNETFKTEVSEDILRISNIVKKMYEKGE